MSEDRPREQLLEELSALRARAEECGAIEAKLHKSERRFRMLSEQTTDAVFCYEYDPPIPTDLPVGEQVRLLYDCVLVECNDVCARSYGAGSSDKVIGKKLPELFGTLPGSLDRLFLELIDSDYSIVDGEGFEVLPDGSKRYFLNNARGTIVDGRLVRVWGSFRDVTASRRTEEALLRERDRARQYLDLAGVMFIALTKHATVAMVNPKCCEVLGYSEDELAGRDWFDTCLPGEIRGQVREVFDRLIQGEIEPAEYFENPVVTKSGEKRIIAWHNTLLRDGDGNIAGTLSSGEDVTERILSDQALRTSEVRYRSLFEEAADMIHIVDADGRIVDANRSELAILGYTRQEYVGKPLFEIVHPEYRQTTSKQLRKTLDGEFTGTYETILQSKDGRGVAVEVSAVPQVSEGTAQSVRAICRDITRRKQAEETLRHRVEFESLVAEISTRFINLPSHLIDAEIGNTLERVTRFCGADNAAVFLLSADSKKALLASYWEDEPDPARLQKVWQFDIEAFLRAKDLLLGRSSLSVSNLDDLPEEAAALRELYASLGFESVASVPMTVQGDVLGFIGFAHVSSQRAWEDDDVRLLEMIGQIISNALQRKRVDEELRGALSEVAALKQQLEAENVYLKEEMRRSHRIEGVVGESNAFLDALQKVDQVAATEAAVLLLGETGTGKDIFAHAIHDRSQRATLPFVKVDCTALSTTLIESQLFGHERGAFTGATTKTIGRFELADGGTVFLDEIGDFPLELQGKLLRVLQDGEFERLGSSKTASVDVRVIAATNHDLEQAVRTGTFRADLYYRLSVFPIVLPLLRERREDIPLLVRYFVAQSQVKLRKTIEKVPHEVMEALTAYDWPGNIRELRNVIERAVVLSPGPALRIDDSLMGGVRTATVAVGSSRLEDVERRHLLQVIEECDWTIRGRGNAADRLGMHPSTLRSRLKKLGIERPGGTRRRCAASPGAPFSPEHDGRS